MEQTHLKYFDYIMDNFDELIPRDQYMQYENNVNRLK
jgi:hypothetical protein